MRHEFAVRRAKLVDYLLSEVHPRGRSKAHFLAGFGFTRSDPEILAEALLGHRLLEPAVVEKNQWGTRYVVEGPIAAPDGRFPRLRTVWQTSAANEAVAQLVTAYPLE